MLASQRGNHAVSECAWCGAQPSVLHWHLLSDAPAEQFSLAMPSPWYTHAGTLSRLL